MMENRVKVRIIGREYTLITENSTEYTQDLAGKLDSKMNEMLSESKNAQRNRRCYISCARRYGRSRQGK